jgi:hypothetical protein
MPSYELTNGSAFKITDDGERVQLANFSAKIMKEIRILDGINTETTMVMEGRKGKTALPPVRISGSNWHTMAWVLQHWGSGCVIFPHSNVKEDLRAAIQLASKAELHIIYRYIGWNDTANGRQYLHKGGAVTKDGLDATVSVELPSELSRYTLHDKYDAKESLRASLALVRMLPPEIGWTLWTATFAPLFGPVDFAVHVTGRTGSFKSETMSLFQSHYGSGMDSRHLPGSWSSTPNALEAQAYLAANAVFVIDDFVPAGTSWQMKSYQTNADKIIRAQGNQAGRARLTDTSNLQQTYYPRGVIFSTGEDTPEGHSVRGRMMISELSPGDVIPEKLSVCQKDRDKYPSAIYHTIKALCGLDPKECDLTANAEEIRNSYLNVGHTRTPSIIGRLAATGIWMLAFARKHGAITGPQLQEYTAEMQRSVVSTGERQKIYLESADPIEIFKSGLRQSVGSLANHLRRWNGGIPPKPVQMGWSADNPDNDLPNYRSHGPCIGWIRVDKDELYLDVNLGFNAIKKACGNDLSLTKQTLMKRLKDGGLMTRVDTHRGRNTIRIVCDGHARTVMCLQLSQIFEMDDDESHSEDPSNGQAPDWD